MTLPIPVSAGQSGHLAHHDSLHARFNNVFDITEYGAVGDNGVTNCTTAIQAAIDAAEDAGGGTVWVPPAAGYYLTSAPLVVNGTDIRIEGSVPARSRIHNATTNVLNLATTNSLGRFTLAYMGLRCAAAGAACIQIVGPPGGPGAVSRSLFMMNELVCWTSTTRAIYATGAAWELLDSVFLNNEIDADSEDSSVSLIEFIDTRGGVFNSNNFIGGRISSSVGVTAPQVKLSCQVGDYMYQNTFQGINFETPNAGAIFAQGNYGLSIEQCGIYDITTATANMIHFEKHASGEIGLHNSIRDTIRIGGTIGSFYDIFIVQDNNATIINSGAPNTGRIDCNGFRTTIINPIAVTIDGIGGITLMDGPNDKFGLLGRIIKAGSGTPEGVHTAAIGSLFLRTNGGASTTLYVKESGAGNTGWIAK